METVTKYGTLKITGDEIFLTCPGSLNKKKYDHDNTWKSLIADECTICLEAENGNYDIYAVKDQKENLIEYRLIIDPELNDDYESGNPLNLDDNVLVYSGHLYVDPQLMITDPASFVNDEVITVGTISKSIKDGESIFCDFGLEPNNDSWTVHVFEILNDDGEVLEYRLLIDEDVVAEYKSLTDTENLEDVDEEFSEVDDNNDDNNIINKGGK